jgi:two-component sensor histidine kinase
MTVIYQEPEDYVAQARQFASPDEQWRDLELVLRESHHRMKNTLTLLCASVRRDFTRVEAMNLSATVDRFERRVVAFGRLYQLLSDSHDVPTVSVQPFFESLAEALSNALLEPAGIHCEVRIACGSLTASQSHRLALMITELVTNAAKHAFPDKTGAVICINMSKSDRAWVCSVIDNGIGAAGPMQGTGGRILEGLARSVSARVAGYANSSGTRVTIVIPIAV